MGFVYPITLSVEGRLCLVLGGNEEAERKARQLEAAGARVRRAAAYAPGLLDGVFLAVLAGQTREVNAAVFTEGETGGFLVNCLDDPPHCRFTFPSIHRQGDLTIAVSTNGACPALAVRIRETLGRSYGPEYARFLAICRSVRRRIRETIPEFGARRALWYGIVESPAIGLLGQGRDEEAGRAVSSLIEQAAGDRSEPPG
ncbi:MAG: hypothetical protein C0504_11435 [Candidatus Solibacter sp.]|nr:hypothetical protein [Candidatus Solibacter sp.]